MANEKSQSTRNAYRLLFPLRRDGEDHAAGSVLELTQQEVSSIGAEVLQRVVKED
ncbi:MAG TPA: hypothetical protein VKZ53_22355 [Candidatus Angelobacter sp.]|nr:hypothetical protein [Candidatus Angelobacter sp.]